MKISPSLPAAALSHKQVGEAPPREAQAPAKAAQVTLSDDAKFVTSIAEEARRGPAVRLDVVERVTEALLDGTYERSVDMSAVISNLARDL